MIKSSNVPSGDILGGGWTTTRLTVKVTFAGSPQAPIPADVSSRMEKPSETAPEDRSAHALVIGANVVSFLEGFSARERSDIIDCMVLARLAAAAKVKAPESRWDARSWFVQYYDVLSNLGFRYTESGTAKLPQLGREFSVVEIMPSVGWRTASEGFIPSFPQSGWRAVRLLGEMPHDSDLVRIINADSGGGKTARLQATVVWRDASGKVKLVAVALFVEGTTPVEQTLSTRFDRERSRVDAEYREFDVDMQVLEVTRDTVARRLDPLRSQTGQYVKSFPDPIDAEESGT